MIDTLEKYREKIRLYWRNEFALHRRAVDLIEPALIKTRKQENQLGLVLDMLFIQVYKSHISVGTLAELGHMEDAATIARRLLEMSVLAGYITEPVKPGQRVERADRYLANLWQELAPEGRAVLPTDVQVFWESVARRAPRGAQPSFQKMFAEIGKHETYQKDYRLLTQIAHGSSPDQLIEFARETIPMRPGWHLGALLVFATKYALATAILWNEISPLIDETRLGHLINDLAKWPEGKTTPNASPEAA